MKKVMVSQEADDFIRKMADEVEIQIRNIPFESEVIEILVEIKRRLKLYGRNDTEQTIRIICEGIDNFLTRHKLN